MVSALVAVDDGRQRMGCLSLDITALIFSAQQKWEIAYPPLVLDPPVEFIVILTVKCHQLQLA
jgi:hypothetical protein